MFKLQDDALNSSGLFLKFNLTLYVALKVYVYANIQNTPKRTHTGCTVSYIQYVILPGVGRRGEDGSVVTPTAYLEHFRGLLSFALKSPFPFSR